MRHPSDRSHRAPFNLSSRITLFAMFATFACTGAENDEGLPSATVNDNPMDMTDTGSDTSNGDSDAGGNMTMTSGGGEVTSLDTHDSGVDSSPSDDDGSTSNAASTGPDDDATDTGMGDGNCPDQTSQGDCEAIEGCTWFGSEMQGQCWGGGDDGGHDFCGSLSEQFCDSVPGCEWDPVQMECKAH